MFWPNLAGDPGVVCAFGDGRPFPEMRQQDRSMGRERREMSFPPQLVRGKKAKNKREI
jgi:hypothetical protein